MKRTKKITVEVPVELLKRAQKVSGAGVTETVRQGLEKVAKSDYFKQILALRGKVHFTESLESIREDRD
jgi:hypothetical protein